MDNELDAAIKDVVAKMKDEPDSAEAVAAAACKLIAVEIASSAGPGETREAVSDGCRAVMAGMLLLEKDLPRTAVSLLSQITGAAQRNGVDPSDAMTWAMEGIAQACRMAPAAVIDGVRAAIDETFMGAGAAFDKLG